MTVTTGELRYAGHRKRGSVCVGWCAIAANVGMLVAGVIAVVMSARELTAPPHWTAWLLPIIFAAHVVAVGAVIRTVAWRERKLGGTPRARCRAWRELDGGRLLSSNVGLSFPLLYGVASDTSRPQLWGTCACAMIMPGLAASVVWHCWQYRASRLSRRTAG